MLKISSMHVLPFRIRILYCHCTRIQQNYRIYTKFSQSTVIYRYKDVKIFPWKAPRWPKLLQLECWRVLRRVIICLLYWLPMTSRIEFEILLLTSTAFWGQTPSLSPKTTLLSDSWFTWGSLNLQKWNGRLLAIRHLCFRASSLSRYGRLTPVALIRLVLKPSPLRDVIIEPQPLL